MAVYRYIALSRIWKQIDEKINKNGMYNIVRLFHNFIRANVLVANDTIYVYNQVKYWEHFSQKKRYEKVRKQDADEVNS